MTKTVEYDANVTRYIPGTTDLVFQGMVQKNSSIKQSAQPFRFWAETWQKLLPKP